jgi:hypothetical protein
MNKSHPAERDTALRIDDFKISVLDLTKLINSDEVAGCLILNIVTNDSMAAIGMVISASSSKNRRYVSLMSNEVMVYLRKY